MADTLLGAKADMGWFFRERGAQWKQGWMEQLLSSSSLPPPSLLLIFAIVLLFLSISWHIDYKTHLHRTEVGFHLLLFLLPVALIVVAGFMLPPPSIHPGGSSPWGLVVVLLVVLLMISYQSSFHSRWFRLLWRAD